MNYLNSLLVWCLINIFLFVLGVLSCIEPIYLTTLFFSGVAIIILVRLINLIRDKK